MRKCHRITTWALLAVSVAVGACGKGDVPGEAKPDAASGAAGSSPAAAAPASSSPAATVVQAQTAPTDPCGWISRADAEKAMGEALLVAPTRVRSTETFEVSEANGGACRYDLPSSGLLKRFVAISITPDESGVMQSAFTSLGNVEEEFKGSQTSRGDTLVEGRWDYVSAMPGGLTAVSKGRIAVFMFASGAAEQGMALAGAMIDRIPDMPFTSDPANPGVQPEGPDPCSLITRQEAEAVLGPLVVAPYRSGKETALVYGAGQSCSYFTGKHRALVVTPRWRNGPNMFQMLGSVAAMVNEKVGGTAAPDTLEGNWDQLATGQQGTLHALKGEKMLSIQYTSSGASYESAVKLVRVALTRL